MNEDDLFVQDSKIELIVGQETRIKRLFSVDLQWNEEKERGPFDPHGSKGSVLHIRANHSGGSSGDLDRAKAFIHSLTLDDADKCVSWERFQPDQFCRFGAAQHDAVESQSQAVVSVLEQERVICIWGPPDRVAAAKALMEQVFAEDPTPTAVHDASTRSSATSLHHLTVQASSQDEAATRRTSLSHTLSPGAESNHDSCYDSDSSVDSRRNSSQRLDADWHSDVSRTASDTLAAEHLDQEDVKKRPPVSKPLRSASSPLWDKDYESKVQFALKLGYSETQLQAALYKLGNGADQNSLLSELIQISEEDVGAGGERREDEEVHSDGEVAVLSPGSPNQREGEHRNDSEASSNLRPIVIDGSNVAMSHGNKEVFSCQGIQIAVEWFQERGHEEITVFVPHWRKETPRTESPIVDQDILLNLERQKILVFTPARRIGGKRVICYDDRYILKLATENGGVVVSNDNYRDLMSENAEYKKVVEERLLMYSFVNDRFMPPEDPLGRRGPSLDNFLRKEPSPNDPCPPVCPYNKKCTYGNKCKYYHPERGLQPHKMVSEKMAEQAKQKIKERKKLAQSMSSGAAERQRSIAAKAKLSKTKSAQPGGPKTPLSRTKSLLVGGQRAAHAAPIPANPLPQALIAPSASPDMIVVSVTNTDEEDSRRENTVEEQQEEQRLQAAAHQRCSQSQGTVMPLAVEKEEEEEGTLLRPPSHWSSNHMALRPIHSDPSCLKNSYGSGHLALAKKLSDESAAEDRQTPSPLALPEQNLHRKLQRQLSLKGPEDHRLLLLGQSGAARTTSMDSLPKGPLCEDQSSRHVLLHATQSSGTWADRPLNRHVPVTRMGSAPVFHVNDSSPANPVSLKPPPPITRQNSTSDPQLNLYHEDAYIHPSASSMMLRPMAQSPLASQPFMTPYGPSRRIAFSPSIALMGPRATPPPLHQQALMNAVGPAAASAHSSLFGRLSSSDQSAEGVCNTSMDGSPLSVASPPVFNSPGTQHLQPSAFAFPDQSNPIPQQPQHLPAAAFSMPGMDHACRMPVQPPPQNGPLAMSDPRYSTYFHLCHLFPKEKVQFVMQQYPYETNPEVLCRYLLSC